MKIFKDTFLFLILIFSVSEIKSADWQPLNRPQGESVTNTYMWIGPADKEKT